MKKYDWRISSRLHIWSAARPHSIKSCEYCETPANFVSFLCDAANTEHEHHWHCDVHSPEAAEQLNEVRYEGLQKMFADRHWLHIWKVGHKGCLVCNKDARVIASYVDASGEIVKQEFLCERHGPWTGRSGRGPAIDADSKSPEDLMNDLKFELGGTLTIRPED